MAEELPAELKDSIDMAYLETSPEIMELIHGWLYKIVDAAYEGIAELPAEHRDRVLMKMSKACSDQAKLVLSCHPGMAWEDYKEHMAGLEPPFGPRKIVQIGDVVSPDSAGWRGGRSSAPARPTAWPATSRSTRT
jgi:hypothetical protein